MTRTPLLAALVRSFQAARFCNRHHIPTREGIELLRSRRRDFLKALPAAACVLGHQRSSAAPKAAPPMPELSARGSPV